MTLPFLALFAGFGAVGLVREAGRRRRSLRVPVAAALAALLGMLAYQNLDDYFGKLPGSEAERFYFARPMTDASFYMKRLPGDRHVYFYSAAASFNSRGPALPGPGRGRRGPLARIRRQLQLRRRDGTVSFPSSSSWTRTSRISRSSSAATPAGRRSSEARRAAPRSSPTRRRRPQAKAPAWPIYARLNAKAAASRNDDERRVARARRTARRDRRLRPRSARRPKSRRRHDRGSPSRRRPHPLDPAR